MITCLADPSRFRVVSLLLEGDYCVSEVARRIGLSQSCTTRHLQTLQRAGVLTRTRAGKRVLFRVREGDPELDRVLELVVLRTPLESHAATASSEPGGRPRGTGHTSPPAARPRLPESLAGEGVSNALTIHAATSPVMATDSPAASDSPSEEQRERPPVPIEVEAAELEDYLL